MRPKSFLNMTSSTEESLVELCNQTFGYGYGDRVILDDISLFVSRGKVTALMRVSGGGKATILRLIGGQNRNWSPTTEVHLYPETQKNQSQPTQRIA